MADIAKFVEEIEKMSVMELNELVKAIEEIIYCHVFDAY